MLLSSMNPFTVNTTIFDAVRARSGPMDDNAGFVVVASPGVIIDALATGHTYQFMTAAAAGTLAKGQMDSHTAALPIVACGSPSLYTG